MMAKKPSLSRRKFIKTLSLTGAGLALHPSVLSSLARAAMGPAPAAKLTGRVVKRGDHGFREARRGFATASAMDLNIPEAVVFAKNDQDIRNAISWVKEKSRLTGTCLPLRPRSGGHCYEGYSSFAKDGLILDMKEYCLPHGERYSIDEAKGEVTLVAGMLMFEAYETLAKHGLAMPLATGPTVGLAGLVMGGGVGITSRKWGTTADHLVSFRMILADGRKIEASSTKNSDLFWACSGGGGGNVGIATDFTFKAHPLGLVGIYDITYRNWDKFEEIVDAWQNWIDSKASRNTTCVLAISGKEFGDGKKPFLELYGQFSPDPKSTDTPESVAQAAIKDMAPMFDPKFEPQFEGPSPVIPMPFQAANRAILFDPSAIENPQAAYDAYRTSRPHQLYKATSAFAMKLMSRQNIQDLKKTIESIPSLRAAPSQPSMVQLLSGGGAIADYPVDSSPNPYRAVKFIYQLDGYWTLPMDAGPTTKWVRGLREQVVGFGAQGAYINYIDAGIPNINEVAFGRKNRAKLRWVKFMYDPTNFFDAPQGWWSK